MISLPTARRRFERAKVTVSNLGASVDWEFVQVTQVVDAGNLGQRKHEDYELGRFDSYPPRSVSWTVSVRRWQAH